MVSSRLVKYREHFGHSGRAMRTGDASVSGGGIDSCGSWLVICARLGLTFV